MPTGDRHGLRQSTADRQANSHSLGLRREKSVENMLSFRCAEPRTCIRHRDRHITRSSHPRAHLQHPRAMRACGHGLDPVYDQVQDDLLHLAAVARDGLDAR